MQYIVFKPSSVKSELESKREIFETEFSKNFSESQKINKLNKTKPNMKQNHSLKTQ